MQLTNLKTKPQKVLERPKQYMDTDNANKPTRITGLRPMRSDVLLHCRTVRAWARKNRDC